jgi:hypothetical protein
LKSESIYLLEPSGPIQDCNGIASPLPLHTHILIYFASLGSMKEISVHLQIKTINPLNAELNPICHLLALLGAHHILYVSKVRVK